MESSSSEILNLVHKLAQIKWVDSPSLDSQELQNKPSFTGRNHVNTPKSKQTKFPRRIQPATAPIKPPDIQSISVFPPIEKSVKPNHTKLSEVKSCMLNGGRASDMPTSPDFLKNSGSDKLQQLEQKLMGRKTSKPKISLEKMQDLKISPPTPKKIQPRRVPRSAEVFSELTPAVITQVDNFASAYCAALDNNKCRSVLEEFTFLFKILTLSRPMSETELSCFGTALNTVSQQVYFVIKVISLQLQSAMGSIDPDVIKLLVEKYPHRIPKVARKHLQSWLSKAKFNRDVVMCKPSEYHSCVTFRSESDGRSNFPCQEDFHSFCKQRDMFYFAIKLWNDRSSVGLPATSADSLVRSGNKNLGQRDAGLIERKIRSIFELSDSNANMFHLASLCVSQYIQDGLTSKEMEEESFPDENMTRIFKSNPDRMAKLSSRFSSQEFSRNEHYTQDCLAFPKFFVNHCGSSLFHQHLIDRNAYEILQIFNFFEEFNSTTPEDIQIPFLKSILHAQLLGYLTFLPYNNSNLKSRCRNSTLDKDTFLSKQLELRLIHKPIVDFYSLILKFITLRKTVLILPTAIEFFIWCDEASYRIPEYTKAIKLICAVYRSILTVNSDFDISLYNKNFLRFWCGKLFTSENFPESWLYDEDISVNEALVYSILLSRSSNTKYFDDGELQSVDKLSPLGENLVNHCFKESFDGIKYILHVGTQKNPENLATSGEVKIKHIKPIPATSSNASELVSEEVKLQKQLEMSFFDSNSPSVKRTVDFIGERIASIYVKQLRMLLPTIRVEMAAENCFLDKAAVLCKARMSEKLPEFSLAKCKQGIDLLIDDTLSPEAKDMCNKIAQRICRGKVLAWMDAHIKEDLFPETSVPKSANKSQPTSQAPCDKELTHEPLILLHRLHKSLHLRQPILGSSLDTVLNCKALSDIGGMDNTLIDFALSLVTFSPELLTTMRIEKIVALLQPHCNRDIRLLCPRNMMLLRNSSGSKSWDKLRELSVSFIRNGLIDMTDVEQDCMSLLQDNLHPVEMTNISKLLSELLSFNSTSSEATSREVVDWVAWLCSSGSNDHLAGEF